MGVFNRVADRSTLLSLCLQWSMSNIMTKAAVKQTLKAKIQGLIARGVDVDEIDQDTERYCLDLYKISGYLLTEEDIVEIYEEIAKG